MDKMIIMLEDENTRYEFYLQGIQRSNIDKTIVRCEIRYKIIQRGVYGSSVSYGTLYGKTLQEEINLLLSKGFKEVTFETMKFA